MFAGEEHEVVLSLPLRSGVLITQLQVGIGIWVTEVITRVNHITIHLNVYSIFQ